MEFLFLRVCFCVCVRVCVFLVWFSTLFGSEWFHSTMGQRKQMHFWAVPLLPPGNTSLFLALDCFYPRYLESQSLCVYFEVSDQAPHAMISPYPLQQR